MKRVLIGVAALVAVAVLAVAVWVASGPVLSRLSFEQVRVNSIAELADAGLGRTVPSFVPLGAREVEIAFDPNSNFSFGRLTVSQIEATELKTSWLQARDCGDIEFPRAVQRVGAKWFGAASCGELIVAGFRPYQSLTDERGLSYVLFIRDSTGDVLFWTV